MEEDIKMLEEFINNYKLVQEKYKDDEIQAEIERSCYFEEVPAQALENLLTRYKEIQLTDKEKEVVEAYRNLVKNTGETGGWVVCDPKQIWSNYFIPKQIVKDKIEEYDKQRIKMEKDDIGVGFTLGKEWSDLKAKIEVLQELLREE